MATFLMFTRLLPVEAGSASRDELERKALDSIEIECPDLRWLANFAVFGPWDYVDVLDAPDLGSAYKASAIVRLLGYADVEVWPAEEWDDSRELVRHLRVVATDVPFGEHAAGTPPATRATF